MEFQNQHCWISELLVSNMNVLMIAELLTQADLDLVVCAIRHSSLSKVQRLTSLRLPLCNFSFQSSVPVSV